VIGSGVLLPGVAENPTFPILSALAYTTGLGYRPTCDTKEKNAFPKSTILTIQCHNTVWLGDTNVLYNNFLKLLYAKLILI